MFKVNNKDTRTTLMSSWCFHCEHWTYLISFSRVSIADLEHVNLCWVVINFNQGFVNFQSWLVLHCLPRTYENKSSKVGHWFCLLHEDRSMVFFLGFYIKKQPSGIFLKSLLFLKITFHHKRQYISRVSINWFCKFH